MDQSKNYPSDHAQAAERLAEAFDRWAALDHQISTNPLSINPEQLAAAWSALEQAHEEWRNSR